ncbi:Hypothetical_protein [Hexamita inflata]|uniref:Hypothetical_protein n=1 Tax=Hexamita inflata TaxID=28002 RepID=A0ABP1IKZ2_9EUKA
MNPPAFVLHLIVMFTALSAENAMNESDQSWPTNALMCDVIPKVVFWTVLFEIYMFQRAKPIIPPAYTFVSMRLFIIQLNEITTKELHTPINPPVYDSELMLLLQTVQLDMVQFGELCDATRADTHVMALSNTLIDSVTCYMFVQMHDEVVCPIVPKQLKTSALWRLIRIFDCWNCRIPSKTPITPNTLNDVKLLIIWAKQTRWIITRVVGSLVIPSRRPKF